MHRLPLLLCLIALAGAGGSAFLALRIGNSKQVLEVRLAESQARATRLETELEGTRAEATARQQRATGLEVELARTSERLAGVEARGRETERALADTRTVLALYESTARALEEEITALRRDLEATRASQASPEAVQAYRQTIADLERQLASARNGTAVPATPGASTAVFTNRAGRATVLSVGPGNAFVVLNFGTARGARPGQRLQVSQGGRLLATVLISDARAQFSVAQVEPDSLRGVLQKGDEALLVREQ
ncbi:MAG: hypothetical protein RLZZ447_1827 [Verrucomicrobiota bacterium]